MVEAKTKKIRNFRMMKLPWGIDLMIYQRGCFKITMKNSKHFYSLLRDIEDVTKALCEFVDSLYENSIRSIECRVTQLVSILRWEYDTEPTFKLNYTKMIRKHADKAKLTWLFQDMTFTHQINWMSFEHGTSSLFFNVLLGDKRIGSFKMYVNLKVVLFTYEVQKLKEMAETIPHFIACHIIPQDLSKGGLGKGEIEH